MLLVDDSVEIRRRLAEMLTGTGQVEIVGEAGDASDGVELARTSNPGLVVLDLRMPGGGGLDALAQMKRARPELTVVVLTNYPFPAYRERCLALGADYFFDKQSEFEYLVDVVREPRAGQILVVDDDSGVRAFVQEVLSRHGYQVMEAVDGQMAQALIDRGYRFKLWITDVTTFEPSGEPFTARLREHEATDVLLTSSTGGRPGLCPDRDGRPRPLLLKPFGADALLAAVGRILPGGEEDPR